MRPLTEQETKTLFAKLASYIGRNITSLIDTPSDPHVFRLHKDRVYYVSTQLANLATSLPRTSLLSLGTCLGKFSKTGKFRLHVTALDFLAQYATYKVWIKQNGEMPFLYGNHVLKAHVGRITQDTPEHQGVVLYSMSDVPLVNFFFECVDDRGLELRQDQLRIRGNWILLQLLFFIRRTWVFIYERKIPCSSIIIVSPLHKFRRPLAFPSPICFFALACLKLPYDPSSAHVFNCFAKFVHCQTVFVTPSWNIF
jgi:60S ribosome subunit biogenesis protein NIP7